MIINEYELERVLRVLEVVNPGRSSEAFIRSRIAAEWPFDNLSTGGWIAYAEAPGSNENVRLALSAYSVNKYLSSRTGPDTTKVYQTRSGKRVVINDFVPYNSSGDLVTFPVKGTITDGPHRTRYNIWTPEGRSNIFKTSPDDIMGLTP